MYIKNLLINKYRLFNFKDFLVFGFFLKIGTFLLRYLQEVKVGPKNKDKKRFQKRVFPTNKFCEVRKVLTIIP